MGSLVKVTLNDTEVWMETEEGTGERGPRKVSREEDAQAPFKIAENIHSTITGYCSSLVKAFDALEETEKPHRITAEFGLRLSGDFKVYVVNAGSEASLKITAEWQTE